MKELYELKEKLMDELAEYGSKEMSAGSLEVVDKLAHSIKNLCKIIEESEYSEMGGSYDMGNGGSYARGGYSRTGISYADGRGRGSQANRDSRGRYSSDDGMIEELRSLMNEAPDQKTRMEFDKFIRKMESMR